MSSVVLKSFSVLHFSDNTIEVAPSKWIDVINKCRFPKKRPKGFQKIQGDKHSTSDPLWPECDIEVIKDYSKTNYLL